MPRKKPDARDARHRWANPELNRAMQGLGSSNAAQPHTPRPLKGTRTARARQAIRDQSRDGIGA